MNQEQKTYADYFQQHLQSNWDQIGLNASSAGFGTTIAFQEAIIKYVGYGAYAAASRTLFGTSASIIMSSKDASLASATVGGFGGAAAGMLVTSIFAAGTITGFVAVAGLAGITATGASILAQSAYQAYESYSSQNDAAPPIGTVFPNDMSIDPAATIFLDPIYIHAEGDNTWAVSKYLRLTNELNDAFDAINDHFRMYGIDLDIDIYDVKSNNYASWIKSFNKALGDRRINEGAGLKTRELLAKAMEKAEAREKHYNDNKEDIDEANPDIAEENDGFMDKLMDLKYAILDRLTPLVIDLSGEGIETISWTDSKASFDFGDDAESSHGWIAPTSGFLALDKNNNGIIDDISELFGSKEADGFTMLSKYDDNGDGLIDENDAIFSQLKIWTDLNGDGRTDDGELISISDLGIVSISLNPSLQNIDNNGNWIPLTSEVTMADGSTREIADVYLTKIKTAPDEEKTIVSDSYVIQGGTENDRLEGTEKDQIFSGGLGADTFVFRENIGNDIIVDFQVNGYNHDILEIHNDAFMDANDVLQHMYQDGNDTILSFDHDNTIRIINTVVNDFNDYNIRVA